MPSWTTIDYIIGMPPVSTRTGDSIHTQRIGEALDNTMPQATIYPGIPSFEFGIDLFSRENAFKPSSEYKSRGRSKTDTNFYLPMLRSHDFNLDETIHSQGLQVAYIADNFPTDTFTNEYGENFLQKFTDVASEGAASIAQMFGKRNVFDVGTEIAGRAKAAGGLSGQIGEMAETAGGYIKDLGKTIFGDTGSKMAGMVGALAAGSRIDFPMVWKTSAFQPSYTMTIRLYNPNPGSKTSTKKYIIAPIAALLLLGVPISKDASTYSWPFLHKVRSPGIYDLDPAYIQNITVIKGGDQQQISWKQSLSMVDVRIDFGSLFSSMLATSSRARKTRPTLRNYLRSMESEKLAWDITGGRLRDSSRKAVNTEIKPIGRNQLATENASDASIDDVGGSIEKSDTPDRVSQAIKDIADEIKDLIPDGFKIST